MNHSDLWLKYQKGDQRAFNQIYDRFKGPLTYYFWRFTKDPIEREDLTHQTFYNAIRSADTYDQTDAKFSTWLYTIAKNTGITWYRKQKLKTRSMYYLDGEPIQFEDPDPGPHQVAVKNEDMKRLHRALQKIPWHFAEMIIMRDLQQKSYEEIVLITGQQMGTVKSRIHRGRELLKKWL